MNHRDCLQKRVEVSAHQTEMLAQHPRAVERQRRQIACGVVILLGAIVIALGSVTPTHAHDIQCGDVLGPGGRFELEHNLEECFPRAVTVQDGAILDLNGHIVTCSDAVVRCIILTGTGAQLLNGTVVGGLHESIVLEGEGWHTVRNVTSTAPVDNNTIVFSDHNQLINVLAESSANPAFVILGNHNRLIDSIARCFALFSSSSCISVGGDENRLINNFATSTRNTIASSGGPGFKIAGDNNVLQGNRAIGNEGPGIVITGTGNRLQGNTALRNSIDLQDTNGDCTQNTWRQNTFETSDPACIGQRLGESVADMER
jgi:parallel beta-helix repeat protein